MNDPYEKTWDAIGKALAEHGKMVLWIAERTLSVKDYKEFINEFTKKQDNHNNYDKMLDLLARKKGRTDDA